MSERFPQLNLETRFSWERVIKTSLALLVGFLLLRTSFADAVSNGVATVLAVIASSFLSIFNGDLLRNGVELREASTGFALSVTEACDGLGISVVFVAVAAALQRNGLQWLAFAKAALASLGIIQAVNLVRIILLYEMLPAHSAIFDITHFHAFPLASSALVAALVAATGNLLPQGTSRKLLTWLAIVVCAAVTWYFINLTVTGMILVPVTNLLVALIPGTLIDAVAADAGRYFVNTNLVTSTSPLSAASLPFTPDAFSLALPLLVASLVLSGAPLKTKGLVAAAAMVSMAVAMSIAAITQAQGEAVAFNLTQVISNARLEPYQPPLPLTRAVLAAVQNTFVYFNLFVLPYVIFFTYAPPTPAPAPAAPASIRPRRRRRNG